MSHFPTTVPSMLDPATLRIEAWPTQPTGGMQAGQCSAGIRVTHVPSGTVATCTTHRYQHQNRAEALRFLAQSLSRSQQS